MYRNYLRRYDRPIACQPSRTCLGVHLHIFRGSFKSQAKFKMQCAVIHLFFDDRDAHFNISKQDPNRDRLLCNGLSCYSKAYKIFTQTLSRRSENTIKKRLSLFFIVFLVLSNRKDKIAAVIKINYPLPNGIALSCKYAVPCSFCYYRPICRKYRREKNNFAFFCKRKDLCRTFHA